MFTNALFSPQMAPIYGYFAIFLIFILFLRFVVYYIFRRKGARAQARELGKLYQAIFVFVLLVVIFLYSKYFKSDPGMFFVYAFLFITAMAAVFWSARRMIHRNPIEKPSISNKCPHCGSQLVLRTARKGLNAGKDFYGCTNYPNCRYTKNIS